NDVMTTLTILETLAEADLGPAVSGRATMTLRVSLARDLVAAALADLRRIHDYERMLLTALAGEPLTLAMRESVWQLLAGWGKEAAGISERVRAVVAQGAAIPELSELDDAIGATGARLTITPAQIEAGVEQAKQGLSIPTSELRDELHARLRA